MVTPVIVVLRERHQMFDIIVLLREHICMFYMISINVFLYIPLRVVQVDILHLLIDGGRCWGQLVYLINRKSYELIWGN